MDYHQCRAQSVVFVVVLRACHVKVQTSLQNLNCGQNCSRNSSPD